jgi:hypothetical protein
MEKVPIPRGSLIRAKARIMADKVIASSKNLETASSGSTDSTASKKPEPRQQGGIRARKKLVPKINKGLSRYTRSIKKEQRKVDKKSSTTIFPRRGRIRRAEEKIRAVKPYTQMSVPAQTRAKAILPEAKIMRAEAVRAARGE